MAKLVVCYGVLWKQLEEIVFPQKSTTFALEQEKKMDKVLFLMFWLASVAAAVVAPFLATEVLDKYYLGFVIAAQGVFIGMSITLLAVIIAERLPKK